MILRRFIAFIFLWALIAPAAAIVGPLPGAGPMFQGTSSAPIGHWVMSMYSATPSPNVPNLATTTPVSYDLLRAPRRLFSNTSWWNAGGIATDNVATAPDGTTQASSFVAAGAWSVYYVAGGAGTISQNIPAGTYTIACSGQANSGTPSFTFFANQASPGGGTNYTSPTKTLSASWQRFTYSFTVTGTWIYQLGFSGSTAINANFVDCELFSGSSDKDPISAPIPLAGHMYLGSASYQKQPAVATYTLDFNSGFALTQMPALAGYNSITVMALMRQTSAPNNVGNVACPLSDATALGVSHFGACTNYSAVNAGELFYNGFASQGAATFWNVSNAGYHVVTWQWDGTTCKVYFDDTITGTSVYPISTTNLGNSCTGAGSITLGDLLTSNAGNNGGIGGNYQIVEMYLWNRAISAAELYALVDGLDLKYSGNLQPTLQASYIFSTGTSILASADTGAGPSGAIWTFPGVFSQNANLFGGGNGGLSAYVGNDYASSGSGILYEQNSLSYFQSLLPPSSRRSGRQFILVTDGGMTNDIGTGAPGGVTAYVAQEATLCDAYIAAGFNRTFLSTIVDRAGAGGGGSGSAWATAAIGINTAITSSWGHCSGIVNTSADMFLGFPGSGASNNLAIFNADAVHPTAAGHAVWEGYLENLFVSIGFSKYTQAFRLYRGNNDLFTLATMGGM